MQRLIKGFKIFLTFVIFFNCLFFSATQESFASGVRDRLRSFANNTYSSSVPDGFDFFYSKTDGFSCVAGPLVTKTGKTDADSAYGLASITDTTLEMTFVSLVEIIFFPILCWVSFKSVFSVASGNTIGGSLGIIVSIVGYSVMEYIIELVIGEDDYNVDPNNTTPQCLVLYWSTFAMCGILYAISQIDTKRKKSNKGGSSSGKSKLTMANKIQILANISAAFFAIKEAVGNTFYKKAKDDFYDLALCGDEWLTYGSMEMQEKYEDEGTDYRRIAFNDITHLASFITRGDFQGSYKYELDRCFNKKIASACQKVISSDESLALSTSDDVDNFANERYRAFREFTYGGMEYAYSGCKDPRPERKNYLGVRGSMPGGKSTPDNGMSQLYYFRGNQAANFACDRFLTEGSDEYMEAYKCCLEASQRLICIRENKDNSYTTTYATVNKFNGSNEANYVMCDVNSSDGSCSIHTHNMLLGFAVSALESACSTVKGVVDFALTLFSLDELGVNVSTDFCDVGSAQDITSNLYKTSFKIVKSEASDGHTDKYCVETYNLCPYNFKLLGGSEEVGKDFTPTQSTGNTVEQDDEGVWRKSTDTPFDIGADTEISAELEKLNCQYDEDGNEICYGACYSIDKESDIASCFNKPSNFCQLDRHCTYINRIYEVDQKDVSPYVSRACMNFVGSSHNFKSYENVYDSKQSRGFTAPIVECVVETFRNVLLNRAGHTKCILDNDISYDNKTCYSGTVYVEGEDLEQYGYESPFAKLQRLVIEIVKVILAIAVVLFGFRIIIKNEGFDPQSISKFVITAALVSYFSLTTAWTKHVFNGIFTVSNYIVELSLKVMDINDYKSADGTSIYTNANYPGCYFFEHDEIPNNYENYGDKSYLAIFDTLDCKLSRYFGYTANDLISAPPIVSLFIAGVFSLGFSILTIIPFIIIATAVTFFFIKIAYQFIFVSLKLTIMLFMAPIMVPLVLLKQTDGIFKRWVENIISTLFEPMFLILSTMLFIIVFDKYFIGDAKFYGTNEPIRDLYCGKICKITDTNFYYIPERDNDTDIIADNNGCINEAKGKIIELDKESPICVSLFQNKIGNSSATLVDMFIDGFVGFPSIIEGSFDSFTMFSNLLFLLIIIFIFNKFIEDASGLVFGGSVDMNINMGGAIKKVVSKFANIANSSSNFTKKSLRLGVSETRGYIQRRKLDKMESERSKDIHASRYDLLNKHPKEGDDTSGGKGDSGDSKRTDNSGDGKNSPAADKPAGDTGGKNGDN